MTITQKLGKAQLLLCKAHLHNKIYLLTVSCCLTKITVQYATDTLSYEKFFGRIVKQGRFKFGVFFMFFFLNSYVVYLDSLNTNSPLFCVYIKYTKIYFETEGIYMCIVRQPTLDYLFSSSIYM
jgi:hypothetical protein